ncbi:helix-turn-helix domain-containing protein [Parasediminibacterium sp. JCM 36343]|uniref:helix-turn-helix domain-containing protein n=1 Tax=Parasediminibacterium sp. JCM 36343 TaxID=3374279 RepID=UPI00397DC798
MKLYIKHMVSLRCKIVVQLELDKIGLHYKLVSIGEVELDGKITPEQHDMLKIALEQTGLELMDDKNTKLTEKIKNVIVDMVQREDEFPNNNFSNYISQKTGYDYTYLSNVFSRSAGVSIAHYIILHKIEKVKELLSYNELNLTEISYQLHYSSVAHLSNQFKKITGVTPTFFKHRKEQNRGLLEAV